MAELQHPYTDWIGSAERREDEIALAPMLAALAMLDDTESMFKPGDGLPPLWHWFYFLPRAPQSQIGPDGHPKRGGFLPPVALPRRMFAGGRLKFYRPLIIGQPAARESTVLNISEKRGATGALVFVTVGHRLEQDGKLCVEEEQDIVYRDPSGKIPAPVTAALPELPSIAWTRTVTPDPVLLFRFSALTFNAHRIHYDRSYAINEEGYPGLVVQGPLVAVLLMDLVRRNGSRPITKYSFRSRAPLFDLAPFRVVGIPATDTVALEAQGPDGNTAMTATAELG